MDRPAQSSLSPLTLFTLRLLALSALAISLFLSAIDLFAWYKAARVHGPYCNLLSFFDCDTVLNSRYANWLRIPVPFLGAAAYTALLILLFRPLHRPAGHHAIGSAPAGSPRRPWWLLCTLTLLIAGAAAWFIYLQTVVLHGSFCLWCMAEHTLGLTLFLLIWLHAFATNNISARGVATAVIVAAIPLAALVAGQQLLTPDYLRPADLMGRTDDKGRYSEVGDPSRSRALVMMHGDVEIDPLKHLILGDPRAPRLIVEVVDYTCPKCKGLTGLLRQARPLLGPGYACLVVPFPLHPDCNKYYAQDYGGEVDPRHRQACRIAALAQAVWLVDPTRYEEFHHWLFDHQDELRENPDLAIEKATGLVGSDKLRDAMSSPGPAGLLARDVDLGFKLGVGALPGLFASNQVFNALPEEPDVLAGLIIQAFEKPVPAPSK